MTPERQSEIIRAACREAGLESHIKWIERASDAQTQAEKLAYRFKGKDRLPVKNSYMYCDTLDMCFYFAGDNPAVSYSGYFTYGKGDLENGRLIDAFVRANGVLRLMKLLAGKEAEITEYIDREAAIKAVRCSPDEVINDELEQIVRYVPAAKVNPVRHGWWKTPAVGVYGCLCSVCKKQSDNCFNYCPNCGAKMDGEPT